MKPKFSNLLIALPAMFAVSSAHAQQSGTWTRTAAGPFNWSDGLSWSGGNIANGSGFTADFTSGFTTNSTATLDSSRTIGHIIKDDTNGALNTFIIAASGAPASILTLANGGSAATITNSDLGGGGRMDITAQISSTEGLTKLGVGNVHLNNNATSWAGNTTVTEGLLHLSGANLANIGGGSGRNISVAAGAAFGSNGLTNAGLNRIVETTAEISILTGSGNNALDFTSATGANLSGAFLGSNLTNGGKTEIQGIITMADNYRLGAVGGFQNGAFGIRFESQLSGTNGLIVGGNRVVIVGTHTFSGDTTIRDGALLGLAGRELDGVGVRNNSSALQNSVLDLGASSATGRIFLEAGTANGIIGLTTTDGGTATSGGTTNATFGGLKGSRDLNSAFLFTGPGNNTSAKIATAITGFTLNTGTDVTASYSGAIGGFGAGAAAGLNGASTLTKTGEGTQILAGVSTYSGATTVSAGTLYVTGALSSSAVTVEADGALGSNGSTGSLGNGLTILAGGGLDLTGATLAEISSGILNITGGSLTLGNLTFQDLIGWNWFDAAAGTYELVDGGFAVDFGSTAYTSEETAYDFGNGKKGYFTSGSLNAVIVNIPEPSTALLGGLGIIALLIRRRRA